MEAKEICQYVELKLSPNIGDLLRRLKQTSFKSRATRTALLISPAMAALQPSTPLMGEQIRAMQEKAAEEKPQLIDEGLRTSNQKF